MCLNEIKTGLSCALPGYVTYTSGGDRKHRGGCAVLIKNRLNDELLQMDRSEQDLIRFRFKQYPKIQFIATYIPPSDSPYFSLDCIARLNTAICENPDDNVVVLGDLNCRYASLRKHFLAKPEGCNLQYSQSPDPATSPNVNAKHLIGVLRPLILLNGLCGQNLQLTHKLTFRQRSRWVSELDHCYASPGLLNSVRDLRVVDDVSLPSNHAPVIVVFSAKEMQCCSATLDDLEQRTSELGAYASEANFRSRFTQRQIRSNVDSGFVRELLDLYR